MNKKFIVVIILAILLALIVSIIMSNNEPKQPRLLKDDVQQEVIEDINFKVEEQPVSSPEEVKTLEPKEIKPKAPVNNIPKPHAAPSVKPKVLVPQTKIEAVNKAVNTISERREEYIKEVADVQQELNDDIVITTEYKFKSPAKYSFK